MGIRISMLRWALALLMAASSAALAEDVRLGRQLDAILNCHAAFGAIAHARVVKLPEREELYARNADKPCKPASNYKLLTTATGLDLFGPRHTFKTWLAADGNDVWIIGTGDPGTGDSRLAAARNEKPTTLLENWAKALKDRGITRIAGDLVYYDGAFEAEPIRHPTWRSDWLVHWYGAPVTGLAFNDNCVDITIFPTEPGKPVRYEIMPPVQDIQITNGCTTVQERGSPEIMKMKGGNIYQIGGTCHKQTAVYSRPVENPGAFFTDAFRVQLAKAGIQVAGKIRRSETPLGGALPPPTDKVVAVHETPILDVLSRINKQSQNLFAEHLCKANGREFDARRGRDVPGSWKSGGEAVRTFLKANGIDGTGLVPLDGTGLSPDCRVTTRIMTDLLAVMAARSDAEIYRNSLSVAGIDGSAAYRLTDLKGRFFLKTGTVNGVTAMSGYVKTLTGEWLAFSLIFNQATDASSTLHDQACRVLARWPDLDSAPSR